LCDPAAQDMFLKLVRPGSLRMTGSAPERYPMTAVSLSRPLTSLNAARAIPSISTRKLNALYGSLRCGGAMNDLLSTTRALVLRV
jgi:hypothetical protein